MEVVRFGVVRVGDGWTVVSDQGDRLHFHERERALRSARDMVKIQRSFGRQVELLAQSELFELDTDGDDDAAQAERDSRS